MGDETEKPKPSPEMNERMGAVLRARGNDVCSDCPEKRPLWVSFLAGRVEKERKLAVLCCTKCAQYHHFELGEKRCLIKYLKMAHEFNLADIQILESSGNIYVNEIFEAKLTTDAFDKELVLEDEEEEAKRRSKFVKQKYKKCKYQDEIAYYQRMLQLIKTESEPAKAEPNPEPPRPEPQPADTADTKGRRALSNTREARRRRPSKLARQLSPLRRNSSMNNGDRREKEEKRPLRKAKSMESLPGRDQDKDHARESRKNYSYSRDHRRDHKYRDRHASSSDRDRNKGSKSDRDRSSEKDRDRQRKAARDRSSSDDDRDRQRRSDRDRSSSNDDRDRQSSRGRDRPKSSERADKDRRKDFTRAKSESFGRKERPDDTPLTTDPGKSRSGMQFRAKSARGLLCPDKDRRSPLRSGTRATAMEDKIRGSELRSSAPERVSLSESVIMKLVEDKMESMELEKYAQELAAAEDDRGSNLQSSAPEKVVMSEHVKRDKRTDLLRTKSLSSEKLKRDKSNRSLSMNNEEEDGKKQARDMNWGKSDKKIGEFLLAKDRQKDSRGVRKASSWGEKSQSQIPRERSRKRSGSLNLEPEENDEVPVSDVPDKASPHKSSSDESAEGSPSPAAQPTDNPSAEYKSTEPQTPKSPNPGGQKKRSDQKDILCSSYHGATDTIRPPAVQLYSRSRSMGLGLSDAESPHKSPEKSEFAPQPDQIASFTDKRKEMRRKHSSDEMLMRKPPVRSGSTKFHRSMSETPKHSSSRESRRNRNRSHSPTRRRGNSPRSTSRGGKRAGRSHKKSPASPEIAWQRKQAQSTSSPPPDAGRSSPPSTPRDENGEGGTHREHTSTDAAKKSPTEESPEASPEIGRQHGAKPSTFTHLARAPSLCETDLKNLLDASDISNDPLWNETGESAGHQRQRFMSNSAPFLLPNLADETEDEVNLRREKKTAFNESAPALSLPELLDSKDSKHSLDDWFSKKSPRSKKKTVGEALGEERKSPRRSDKKTVGEKMRLDALATPRSNKKKVDAPLTPRSQKRRVDTLATPRSHKNKVDASRSPRKKNSKRFLFQEDDEKKGDGRRTPRRKDPSKRFLFQDDDAKKARDAKGKSHVPRKGASKEKLGKSMSVRHMRGKRDPLARTLSHESGLNDTPATPRRGKRPPMGRNLSHDGTLMESKEGSKASNPHATPRRGRRALLARTLSHESLMGDKGGQKDNTLPASLYATPKRSRRGLLTRTLSHESLMGNKAGPKNNNLVISAA